MQVDFYQLTRDPAEKLVPVLAQKVIDAGQRLLVISASADQRRSISRALWLAKPESFLAHAETGEEINGRSNDAAQPILLNDLPDAKNGARFALIADGQWRGEIAGMERIFYLFAPEHTDDARGAWRGLGDRDDITRRYWRQDGGRWTEGP